MVVNMDVERYPGFACFQGEGFAQCMGQGLQQRSAHGVVMRIQYPITRVSLCLTRVNVSSPFPGDSSSKRNA